MKQIIFSLSLIVTLSNSAQDFGVGMWRDHLPYSNVIQVAKVDQQFYAASPYGVYMVDELNGESERYNSINGLSDFDVTTIASNEYTQNLIVGYGNGNIDLIKDGLITNINAIKISSVIGDKGINAIHSQDNISYLACGFGIVVLDLNKEEVKDTYVIGPGGSQLAINDITILNNEIFAATDFGVYKANLNAPFLSDFNEWSLIQSFPNFAASYEIIHSQDNSIFIVNQESSFQDDTIKKLDNTLLQTAIHSGEDYTGLEMKGANELLVAQNYNLSIRDENLTEFAKIFNYGYTLQVNSNHAIWDGTAFWIGDAVLGLNKVIDNGTYTSFTLPGPKTNDCFHLAAKDDKLYVSSGKVTGSAWNNSFDANGVMSFDQYDWRHHNRETESLMPADSSFDFLSTAIDPKDEDHAVLCSYYGGLFEMRDNEIVERYATHNSALQVSLVHGSGQVKVGAAAIDKDGNIWAANSFVANPLVLIQPNNGGSIAFNLGGQASNAVISDILIEEETQNIWITIPGEGIVVFDYNGTLTETSDDSYRFLGLNEGSGHLPAEKVNCITQDLDGEVWVGTEKGPAIFFNPTSIMDNTIDNDAQQILIQQDGSYQKLLETQDITRIAIDGANRKWFATTSGGVFLMSEDGTEEIYAFNTDNSPIFSNTVLSLAINGNNGEVFIGTNKGLIGFKSTATDANQTYQDIYCYPNPVRPEYSGPIAVKGLTYKSDVKITDASGGLVATMTSEGGQAVWDGNDLYGNSVKSGVYYAFVVSEDGRSKGKTKVLIIR